MKTVLGYAIVVTLGLIIALILVDPMNYGSHAVTMQDCIDDYLVADWESDVCKKLRGE